MRLELHPDRSQQAFCCFATGSAFGRSSAIDPSDGVQIAIILLLLSRLVGWQASIGGFVTSLLLVPVSAAVMKRVASVRQRLAPLTDARVKLCSEIVAGDVHNLRADSTDSDAIDVP
jgi:hypothetical protein